MALPDESADFVQPEEGQGGEGTGGDPPYADYLSRIPEEVRGQVEPVFKDWDAQTTRKFQEHSEYRKQWEPYEQSGINQLDPETVQWLTQFAGALDNPQAIQEWFQAYAQQHGLQQEAPAQESFDEQFAYEDPNTQLKQMLDTSLSPIQQRLEQFAQWQEQQEQAAAFNQAQQYISSQVDALKQKHPQEFDSTAEKAVEQLVAQYIDSDPRNAVPRAWADWQQIRNTLEKQTLQGKTNQGAGAEAGGVPNVLAEMPKTMEDANRLAKDWLRSRNQAEG